MPISIRLVIPIPYSSPSILLPSYATFLVEVSLGVDFITK